MKKQTVGELKNGGALFVLFENVSSPSNLYLLHIKNIVTLNGVIRILCSYASSSYGKSTYCHRTYDITIPETIGRQSCCYVNFGQCTIATNMLDIIKYLQKQYTGKIFLANSFESGTITDFEKALMVKNPDFLMRNFLARKYHLNYD